MVVSAAVRPFELPIMIMAILGAFTWLFPFSEYFTTTVLRRQLEHWGLYVLPAGMMRRSK